MDLSCQCRFKLQRLKTRSQFQVVLAGKTVARTTHFALHCATLAVPVGVDQASKLPTKALFGEQVVWIGAMVPKRWAKRAVTRNAIKRQIYHVSEEFESILPVAAHLVRLRAGFDAAQFVSATSDRLMTAVRQELQALFVRATGLASSPILKVE